MASEPLRILGIGDAKSLNFLAGRSWRSPHSSAWLPVSVKPWVSFAVCRAGSTRR
jgi:hypothetical protein